MTSELWFIMMALGIASLITVTWITYPLVMKYFKNRTKKAEETPLSDMQKAFFIDRVMPCCGSEQYKEGPSGGMLTNIMCSKCSEEWNVCLSGDPMYIKKIHRLSST